MISKKDDSIQAIQAILNRTHKGRIIKEEAFSAVQAWKNSVNTEYSKTECKNCGLILKSNYFVNGCVNCKSTDVEPVKL